MVSAFTATPLRCTPEQRRAGIGLIAFSGRAAAPVARIEPSSSTTVIVVPRCSEVGVSAAGRDEARFADAFLVAAGAGPISTEYGGRLDCVEIALPPWGPRALLGERPSATDGPVRLDDLIGDGPPGDSSDAVAAWVERQLHAVRWLPSREVRYAAGRLRESGGRLRIASLAEEIGWSERYLSARFADANGVTPKRFARLVRFEAARRDVLVSDAPLAGIAIGRGYADQAHMTREFVEFSGATPSATRRNGLA